MLKQSGAVSGYRACVGALETDKSASVADHREHTIGTVAGEADMDTIIYDVIETMLSSGKKKKKSVMGMKK